MDWVWLKATWISRSMWRPHPQWEPGAWGESACVCLFPFLCFPPYPPLPLRLSTLLLLNPPPWQCEINVDLSQSSLHFLSSKPPPLTPQPFIPTYLARVPTLYEAFHFIEAHLLRADLVVGSACRPLAVSLFLGLIWSQYWELIGLWIWMCEEYWSPYT